MAILPRVISLTPMDALRVLVAEYAEGDTTFANRLTPLLQTLRRHALPVLGPLLGPGGAPKGLRKLLLAQVARFDWPEWVPYIQAGLLVEQDLGTFDEGCTALGALGLREAMEALKTLQGARSGPDHQTILNRELAPYLVQQPFAHYLSRMLEGSGNPRLAVQGAKVLAGLAEAEDLSALDEALATGDEVVRHLTLRILAGIPGAACSAFLANLVAATANEIVDNETLLELLHKTHALARASSKAELKHLVCERFEERAPGAVKALSDALARPAEESEGTAILEPLRAISEGHSEAFLLESLGLLIENKVARFSAFHSETTDTAEARREQLNTTLDALAEALSRRVVRGFVETKEVIPTLVRPFRLHLGGDAFLMAFLGLLPATETALLDEILADPDHRRRQRCIELLGNREDDAFTPFFLKAMQDSIVDVGQLASHFVSKLPSGLPALMAQFNSGHFDQIRRAIWAFGENHTQAAAVPLLEFIRNDPKDELLVEAVEALANLKCAEAIPTFMELLHDGKPLALQVSLASALGLMGKPQASLGLLQKAPLLKHPQVLVLCLEGALRGFPGFENPLPPEHLPALLSLVERCCDDREGEGQRVPAMLAMLELYTFDQGMYEKLKDRFSDFLFDMRTKANWDRDSNERVAAVIKELGRRSSSLALLAKKEGEIKGLTQKLGEGGPRRTEHLLALREALSDPEFILRPELGSDLADVVMESLQKKIPDWKEVAYLCEIGGLVRQPKLVDTIRGVFARATGLGLKSSARKALLNLGLTEADVNRKAPIHSILVLEPSAFFRKRLVSSLASVGRWQLQEAGNRAEAKALLEAAPVDLLLSESQDQEGDLAAWLEAQWTEGRCRSVLFSVSSRDLGALAEAPWVETTLFKPYPIDQLLRALGE